jgi:hypothetical protein
MSGKMRMYGSPNHIEHMHVLCQLNRELLKVEYGEKYGRDWVLKG